jgi:hypothetical protein
MADARKPPAQLIRFRPKPDQILRLIRKLLKERKVSYLNHAELVRMPQRGFDVFDIDHVIETGMISGQIRPGAKRGEWEVKLVSWLDWTSRKMGVVVIVVRESRLLIKTAEWEDR